MKYFLGIDLGSSSIKLALVDSQSGKSLGVIQEPNLAMPIISKNDGWAEQNPEDWWSHVCTGIKRLKTEFSVNKDEIKGIGIAYQMHGLVLLDKGGNLLRDAIIWCDSRAVEIGDKAYDEIGTSKCDRQLLNSPANFTASKLAWVKENEPDAYRNIHKFMLPGDYIAYRLSGLINTTVTGLSEGIFWDYQSNIVSDTILEYYGIDKSMVPDLAPVFGNQAEVCKKGATESGLQIGTPLLYRAGDQPNNAMSLNVFEPGEVAATCGTSGVVYAVTDNLKIKEAQRLNNFVHVNHSADQPRVGKLLCINGAGIQYNWLKETLDANSFEELNALAERVPQGAEGLLAIPFGNGAERMLYNSNVGAKFINLDFNRHTKAHMSRATLEGIAFAFFYGLKILKNDGVDPKVIRVGNDNMFRSKIFAETISTLSNIEIEVYDTTGAIGAARACAFESGKTSIMNEFMTNDFIESIKPLSEKGALEKAFAQWEQALENDLQELKR